MAGERVTNLKVLKGYLYADVRLGHDANGNETTISVRLATGRAEVQEALEPLYDLLRSTGRSLTIEAVTEAAVAEARDRLDREVREKAPAAIEARVGKHTAQIEHALTVVASVSPVPLDGNDDYYAARERKSAIRQLLDALRRANI